MKIKYFIYLIVLTPIMSYPQAETLKILGTWRKYSDVDNALYQHYSLQDISCSNGVVNYKECLKIGNEYSHYQLF
ncbi:MAG: hypothetical protein ABFS12_06925 [Bacteroidota bacterium]